MQSGLGPFLAIFLITSEHWNAADIGVVMTVSGIATLIAQTPAGAFIDATRFKRLAVVIAALVISVAALVVTLAPRFGVVAGAQVLLGGAASIFPPATAAIALGLVGHTLFDVRQGRNQSFNAAGNVFAAVAMGVLGYMVSM
ncbi:MAG: MFS transporter, partial [Acetobacteraceae bacterium]